MVGMRDVAKKAGVSLSTVSLVVNGTGYVSDEMRDRVSEAIRSLNYIPNELARNLYHDRTNIVGVIVPTIRHPFFATLTANLQREFSARGLRTLLCSTMDTDSGETEYVDRLRRHMMDGIVVSSHTTHDPEYWKSVGRSVVALDRFLGSNIPSVGSDHEQGGRLIAEQLISSGARHVAMIGGPREQFHDRPMGEGTTFPTIRYYLTLEGELDRAGIRHDYIEAGEVYDFGGYGSAVREVFERYDGEDAVDAVVCSDIGAAYCVQEAMRRGIRIPEDLQIIAYDGTYLADVAGMRLTAVCQNFESIAAAIATRMMGAIEGSPAEGAGASAPGAEPDAEGAGEGGSGEAGDAGDAIRADGIAGTEAAAESSVFVPVRMRAGETTR